MMRIGAVQMFIRDSVKHNLDYILKCMEEAQEKSISFLLFPEVALTGFNPKTLQAASFQDDLKDALSQFENAAQKLNVGVAVGHAEFVENKLYNTATVILPNGRKGSYHKINLTSTEEKFFTPGHDLFNFSYQNLNFGVIICRDQNDPLLAKEYKKRGADVLLILSGHYYEPHEARFKIDKNRALPIARAVENNFYVFFANTVGSHIGMVSLGNSLIAGPDGVLVALADEFSPAILAFDVPQSP